MKNRYEDPTQRLQSHGWSEEYKENYEKIFGKKETWLERREREQKDKPPCADGSQCTNKCQRCEVQLELPLDDNCSD